jgi:hypothetical protein
MGDVKYILQPDGTTILAKNCPMSEYRDFCPLINSAITCAGYTNRAGYGNPYFENCCADTNPSGVGKMDPLGGTELSYIALTGNSHSGKRLAYVNNVNGNLVVVRGQCRRQYISNTGLYMNSCRQSVVDTSTSSPVGCDTSFEFASYMGSLLADFPL